MLKILKLDEEGNPITNEDGTYVIEDFNLDEALNNAVEEFKLTQVEANNEEAIAQAEARVILEEKEKKERIDFLEKELAVLKEQVKRNSGTGAVIESNESEKTENSNQENKSSMGINLQTNSILGGGN